MSILQRPFTLYQNLSGRDCPATESRRVENKE
jgi:hypothetical protein